MALSMIVYLIRGCRRAGRVFTFDVMYCLAGLSICWGDLGPNVFHPVSLPSSNWTNVNNMCGHIPGVINPDCGRLPDNLVFNGLVNGFGMLGVAMLAGAFVRWLRVRRPGISNMNAAAAVLGALLVVDVLAEAGFAIPLGLWSYAPSAFSIPIGHLHYSVIVMVAGASVCVPVLVRVFKDDRGRTVVERGLERHSQPVRTAISGLALYAIFQLSLWVLACALFWPMGFYSNQWSTNTPVHIVNDACDVPGSTTAGSSHTRYGPCPGSPGYRMPVRHSLSGDSP